MLKNCRKMLKNCWKKLEILMKKDRKIAKKNVNLPNVRVRVRSATTSNWVCAHVCVRTLIWTCEVRACEVHACDPKKGRNSHLASLLCCQISIDIASWFVILFLEFSSLLSAIFTSFRSIFAFKDNCLLSRFKGIKKIAWVILLQRISTLLSRRMFWIYSLQHKDIDL